MSKFVQNTTFESRVCLCVKMCEIKTWKRLICAFWVRPSTCREGGRETISLCTVQLSKSLFDFVKCKSRSATAAKYRYEIQRRAKTNCFCNTISKQNALNIIKIQLEDKKGGFSTILLTHRTQRRNMKANRGFKCWLLGLLWVKCHIVNKDSD